LIRSLARSLLVLVIFVPVAAALPLAALSLCRTPDGAMVVFWAGPWSCCFWVLIYSQLSAAPWRQGAEAVRQWREAHGGLLVTSVKATVWMFGALFLSCLAEFLLLFSNRSATSHRAWLPVATYSPLALVWAWRRLHG
jgi:hypothetical protein